ncbi:MAG TPA: 50S ribosomal protein L25 [Saprospiraceae bacterium]|nr:50S ribosomal protein L25 [Saprospiraceae bacterium]
METVKLEGKKRDIGKKKHTRALRNSGAIPCVIYGGEENIHFSTVVNDVKSLIYTPDFKKAEVEIDGTSHKCVVKEIQFHPVSDEVIHIDFQKLIPGKKVTAEIPMHIQGTAPGIIEGGVLRKKMRKIRVKSDAASLVHEIIVDVSALRLGDIARVSDLEKPEGVQIMLDPQTPVVSIDRPRKVVEVVDEEAEGEEEATEEPAATE